MSLFWATSEYADSRGRSEAKRLARDILVDPSPTPTDKNTAWDPVDDSVFIIPDDTDVRIQLTRGADCAPAIESTAQGPLAFTC